MLVNFFHLKKVKDVEKEKGCMEQLWDVSDPFEGSWYVKFTNGTKGVFRQSQLKFDNNLQLTHTLASTSNKELSLKQGPKKSEYLILFQREQTSYPCYGPTSSRIVAQIKHAAYAMDCQQWKELSPLLIPTQPVSTKLTVASSGQPRLCIIALQSEPIQYPTQSFTMYTWAMPLLHR